MWTMNVVLGLSTPLFNSQDQKNPKKQKGYTVSFTVLYSHCGIPLVLPLLFPWAGPVLEAYLVLIKASNLTVINTPVQIFLPNED